MYRILEERYAQDVMSLIEIFAKNHCEIPYDDMADWNDYFSEMEFGEDVILKLLSKSDADKTEKGSITIDGNLKYFLAFCLQEGELSPEYTLINESGGYSHYDGSRPCVSRQDGFNLGEWREYLKNKYQIFPPKLGKVFKKLLKTCISINGGIEKSLPTIKENE
jgi:hypothetical protein